MVPAGTQRRRARWPAALMGGLLTLALLAAGGPAVAAPVTAPPPVPSTSTAPAVSAKQAQAAGIALSLQVRGHQLEVLAERLNRAKIQVDQVTSRIADAPARVGGARGPAGEAPAHA